MGKIMINGESYPSYVVKTGVDDTGIFEDKAWSSKKTSDEIAEVETALPNIKKFANPGGTAKYITISGATLGDIEVHSAYAGKYMFTSTGAKPIFFGTSTYLGYTLTGWAWSSDKTKLYLRVNGQRDFVISAFGSDGVEISDMTTTAPTDVTFNTTFNYNAYIDNSTSENTSTYSSAKIDTELNKKLHTYSYQWYGNHNRYVKLGSVPISTGSVSVGSLLVTLFASSTKLEEYPIGTINLNISSGASTNAFNINGFSTIALNIPRADNYYTPRIVVDKTSTHYVLYIDCSYNYLKVNCSILNSTNFTFGDFETASDLEGTEVWSSVTSDDIKYVGEMSKVITRSLTLKSGYAGYITETYDPTTKVVVYNVNVSGTFKGLLNSIADGFRVPKGSTSSSDVMHQTIGMYGSSSAMTGDAQFTRLLVRNYGNPHLEVDVNAENTVISGTITYVTA